MECKRDSFTGVLGGARQKHWECVSVSQSQKGYLNSFYKFSLGISQLGVLDKAFIDRRRCSGYLETLFKQIKTPEDLHFRKKSSTGEHSSLIFVVFSDVILICGFQLRRFSIEEGLTDILRRFWSNQRRRKTFVSLKNYRLASVHLWFSKP